MRPEQSLVVLRTADGALAFNVNVDVICFVVNKGLKVQTYSGDLSGPGTWDTRCGCGLACRLYKRDREMGRI